MPTNILALDVGSARVGVALANDVARLAAPLTTLHNDESLFVELKALIAEHAVTQLVIGWPRGLDGQDTAQTQYVADFMATLQQQIDLPAVRQDEALTSQKAEAELRSRGKPYDKAAIDSLSATYILEDYLNEGVH